MQREIKASKPTPVKSGTATKSQERELTEVVEYMVDVISKRFKSGAIDSLQAKTVDKFADAQSGNYAKIFLGLAGKVTNGMLSQFSDDRIEQAVSKVLKKVDKLSKEEFYSRVEKAVGISSKALAETEGMKETTNALMLETSQWVKKLRDETLELYTSNTLRAMALGNGLEGITAEFDQLKEKRKNHAKFTARNQINNYNAISTKIRAQNLGITQAIWVTAHDERVRPSHEAREGKIFNLDEGLYSSLDGKYLLPGTDYQCRCTMQLIIPEE